MVVVYAEVFEWVGRLLAEILNLGWGGEQSEILAKLLVWGSTSTSDFPGLQEILINREASVEFSLARHGVGERRSQDVCFTRDLNDWELELVDFLHTLESNISLIEHEDCMRWTLKKNAEFDICSYYNELQGPHSIVSPWKGIWRVKAPRRVSLQVWTETWGKILTGDNLRNRGFAFVDWCVMCRCCEEIVNHLLLHCQKAHQLLCFVFRYFGISWVLPIKVSDALFDWQNWLWKHSSDISNLVSLHLTWCIWRERNGQTFEDVDGSKDQLLASFSGSCLTGIGLGESDLVTPYLYLLVLFSLVFKLIFSFFFLLFPYFFFVLLVYFVLLLRTVASSIQTLLIYKKKKKKKNSKL